ncbi:aconitase family protein [Bordetella sp. BOR01]|uniref:aconitase family protein n=1 Tax=Bordetella sp. BOR01 TaxID=2854779 RepID=UPI001C48996C|nr:aconitase family protein [Bordetella sp. BOR01]MBV7486048.1 hypothetical protein [Bordetella sp. BOR01]
MAISSRGLTAVEKVLARSAGLDATRAGDVVWATPDLVIAHDLNYQRHRKLLQSLGYPDIAAPDRLFVTIDHTTHSDSANHLESHAFIRRDTREQGVRWFMDTGRQGISHNAPLDLGIVRPGMLVVAADTRAPALGGCGAIGVALGLSVALALATGRVWLRVPQTLRVGLHGRPGPGVMSRDIGQWVAAAIGAERADYCCIEFHGDTLNWLDEDGRHTLCNAMVDIGVKTALCPVRNADGVEWRSDRDAVFADDLHFNIEALSPQVCVPPDPQHVVPLATVVGRRVTAAFIGSCIGGKLEDLRAAAQVLEGRRVHPDVRLTVIPATQAIYRKALEEGLVAIFLQAGADLTTGICGPCYGTYAPVGNEDVLICTATRNDAGRLGSDKAPVYLANAAVVAASAVSGHIADPAHLAVAVSGAHG